MTIIETIRAEIERRIKECVATYPKDKGGYWFPEQEEAYAIAEEYKQLLSFLDTLEESDFPTTDGEIKEFLATHPKVEVPDKYKTPDWLFEKMEKGKSEEPINLEKEMDDYFETMPVFAHENIFEETFQMIARHFYELGRSEKPNNHLEHVPEIKETGTRGLDEAAEAYEGWADTYNTVDYPTYCSVRDAFKAGAEWAFGQGLVYEGDARHHGESGDTVYVEHPSSLRKRFAKMFKHGDKVIVQIRKK